MPSITGRRALVMACLLFTAGCVTGGPGTDEPTVETPALNDTGAGSGTPTPGWHQRLQNEREPTTVRLRNDWNESVQMRLRVVRDTTGETVFDERYDVVPGSERDVYSTTRVETDRIESFTLVLTARNTTERTTIRNNACFADAVGVVNEDGTVDVGFVIC